jgi:hypothetical protein
MILAKSLDITICNKIFRLVRYLSVNKGTDWLCNRALNLKTINYRVDRVENIYLPNTLTSIRLLVENYEPRFKYNFTKFPKCLTSLQINLDLENIFIQNLAQNLPNLTYFGLPCVERVQNIEWPQNLKCLSFIKQVSNAIFSFNFPETLDEFRVSIAFLSSFSTRSFPKYLHTLSIHEIQVGSYHKSTEKDIFKYMPRNLKVLNLAWMMSNHKDNRNYVKAKYLLSLPALTKLRLQSGSQLSPKQILSLPRTLKEFASGYFSYYKSECISCVQNFPPGLEIFIVASRLDPSMIPYLPRTLTTLCFRLVHGSRKKMNSIFADLPPNLLTLEISEYKPSFRVFPLLPKTIKNFGFEANIKHKFGVLPILPPGIVRLSGRFNTKFKKNYKKYIPNLILAEYTDESFSRLDRNCFDSWHNFY